MVLDARGIASGTTSRGEGNILVSDKAAGPELELGQLSRGEWLSLSAELGPAIELEEKGGVIVASEEAQLRHLHKLAIDQRAAGLRAEPMDGRRALELEPHLRPDILGGVHYPEDMQVQPVLACHHLLAAARRRGAEVRQGERLSRIERDGAGRIKAAVSDTTVYPTRAVVNATGPWAGELSRRLGAEVPVSPRRGFILVTEPLPLMIRHKVYTADYVDNVASDAHGLETSTVVESTLSGTVLVGASRDHVDFDTGHDVSIVRKLARQATDLYPFLNQARLIRTYSGFRPYSPDHLPIIGHDHRQPGLLHACGHEGAGIGLAPATGRLVAELLTQADPSIEIHPFRPDRFEEAA